MGKRLDDYQKDAVHILRNAVVSAGAGSGKTTVLSERFSYLVTEKNYKIDEILTLTFTKKATVEMKGRIFKTLQDASEKNENAKVAVSHFNQAQIKTLDSYCSEIAKKGARFYGITPSFTQDKDIAEQKIKDMALPFLLENKDNIAIQTLTKTMDFNRIADDFFVKTIVDNSTVANPIEFEKDLEEQIKEIEKAWNLHFEKSIKLVSQIKNAYLEGGLSAGFEKDLKNAFEKQWTGENIVLTKEMIKKSDSSLLEEYIKTLGEFTKFKKPRESNKPSAIIARDSLIQLYDEIDTLVAIADYVSGYKVALNSAKLLKHFQSKVNKSKRTSGILTFKDVSDLAIRVLKEHPEIRQTEKSKFKAIMIDEFQDNNELQRDLLFMLSENPERMEIGIPKIEELETKKLFFVGDEKQSIYKFRGADVSVFRKLKDDLKGEDGGGNLDMKMNYRSDAELIASFNTFFGGIPYPNSTIESKYLPSIFMTQKQAQKDNVEIPSYEAEYNEVLIPEFKIKEASKSNFQNKKTHIALFKDEKQKEDSTDSIKTIENEAFFVATEIKKYLSGEKKISTVIFDEDKPKKIEKNIKASDIAILLKSTTAQPIFERMLLAQGIPYSTEIFKGFFNDGPVNDFISFLSLCAYPNDKNSYAELLCSPFVNLSIEETQEIISTQNILEEKDKTKREPFDEECIKTLSKESKKRFLDAKKIFSEMKESSKTDSISTSISKLWYKFGYRYETLWNRDVDMYSNLYDMLFELARKADESAKNLATFVDEIKVFIDEKEKVEDLDIPLEARDAVRIMTIHKSKGLEFPVVFVPATANKAKGDTNENAVFISKKFGAVVNTPPCKISNEIKSKGYNEKKAKVNYFFDMMKNENDAKAAAELRRLAYVAFTRAENELYITGCFNGKFSSEKKPAECYLPGIPNTPIPGMNINYKAPTTIYNILQPIFEFYQKKDEIDEEESTLEFENAPFDFSEIEKISRSAIFSKSEGSTRGNNEIEKRILVEKMVEEYKNSKIIEKDFIPTLYVQPSNLHEEDDETVKRKKVIIYRNTKFSEINELVQKSIPKSKKSSEAIENENGELELNFDFEGTVIQEKDLKPEFNFNNFGSIAHAYMESFITGNPPEIKNSDLSGLHENEKDIEKVKAICREMQKIFETTDLGQRAKISEWKRAEYGFRSRINYENEKGEACTKVIKGTMDLVFKENDGKYTIVDYKSNQVENPNLYIVQLACYKNALVKMLNTTPENVNCVLYYLRFGDAIDITKECDSVDIQKAVKNLKFDEL